MGGTQNPRSKTPKVRPETQDPGPIRCAPRPKTRTPYFTWDPRPEALDTERETSELNQMSYKQDLIDDIFDGQSYFKTTAGFTFSKQA